MGPPKVITGQSHFENHFGLDMNKSKIRIITFTTLSNVTQKGPLVFCGFKNIDEIINYVEKKSKRYKITYIR